jgi:hypothetical protein
MKRRGFLQALFGLAATPALAKVAPLLPEVAVEPALTVSGFVPVSEYAKLLTAEELNGMWIAFMHESMVQEIRVAAMAASPPIIAGELGVLDGVRLIRPGEIFEAPPCEALARQDRPAYRQLLGNRWER